MNTMEVMGINELTDTIFLKDFSRENEKLTLMEKELERITNIDANQASKLKKDIFLKKQGIYGERNVYFELKNSLLPMICFHDINIKVGENSAQIDFLVITNKFMCIMETKNLVGDIKVNQDGDFIREIKYKDGTTREGMYNPITQGRRHARILKKALMNAGITEAKNFHIEAIAVMANHKNIIDKKEAPSEIANYIYRCDQIVSYLEKELSSQKYGMILSDANIKNMANKVLEIDSNNVKPTTVIDVSRDKSVEASKINTEKSNIVVTFSNKNETIKAQDKEVANINSHRIAKIQSLNKDISVSLDISDYQDNKSQSSNGNTPVSTDTYNYSDDKLVKMLRKFRYEKAKENNREPYEVFTNKEMDLLVSNRPKTINDLKKFNLRSWVITDIGTQLLEVINPGVKYQKTSCKVVELAKVIEKNLMKYRDEIAVSKNLKAYEVFTNAEITRVIEAMPSTLDELFEIKGFNKIEKLTNYGKDILKLIQDI